MLAAGRDAPERVYPDERNEPDSSEGCAEFEVWIRTGGDSLVDEAKRGRSETIADGCWLERQVGVLIMSLDSSGYFCRRHSSSNGRVKD
jgi:hypothetical protein